MTEEKRAHDHHHGLLGPGVKKILCNPPAVMVAAAGDPEVCGLFEGAGEGIAEAMARAGENHEALDAIAYFEKHVVTVEHQYIEARKALAAETTERMQGAINRFMTALGVEPYGGG